MREHPTRICRLCVGLVVTAALALAGSAVGCGRHGGPAADAAAKDDALKELQSSYAHYHAGRYEEAVASAKAVLEANPDSSDAYTNLAVSYLALKQFDDAEKAAQEAIRLQPDSQLAKNNLAWIQGERRKSAEPSGPTGATAESKEVIDLLNTSFEHSQAGRYEECIATALRAAQLSPSSARAFNNAAVCAAQLGRWDEAVRNAEEAVRLDPNFELARNNLSWMRGEKSRADGAAGGDAKRE